jgi:hypothetical protein
MWSACCLRLSPRYNEFVIVGSGEPIPERRNFVLTLMSYFDESGKFKDQRVVAFGGVIGVATHMNPFFDEWHKCLYQNGLPVLSMKQALRHDRPLSEKKSALGATARVEALLPFIYCIRKHLLAITGIALDTEAFRNLPSHYHQLLGDDPFVTAFLRMLIEIVEMARKDDKFMLVCDDEEAMALPMYKLYRRVKLIHSRSNDVLKSLCFGDDEYMYALQAADCVASIMRREADRKFFGTSYDYGELFAAMTKNPDRSSEEKIWACNIAFADKEMLSKTAENLKQENTKGIKTRPP